MDKNTFVKIMNAVQDMFDFTDRECDLLNICEHPLFTYLDRIIDAVCRAINDVGTDELPPLTFGYMFDHNYGKYEDGEYLIKIDDVCYVPTSWEELYDVIMEARKED